MRIFAMINGFRDARHFGVWLVRSALSGMRFMEHFEITKGLMLRQNMWNDLAEAKVNLATPDGTHTTANH